MFENQLTKFRELGELTEKDVTPKFIKKGIMKMNFSSYYLNNYGNLSFSNMTAMFGLMKMYSCVFTPIEKDMPLMSMDIIIVGKTYQMLLEVYDTCLEKVDMTSLEEVKNKYQNLLDRKSEERWYDPLKMPGTLGKKEKGGKVSLQMMEEWFDCYFNLLKNSKNCEISEKRNATKKYVDGLLIQGGPSTEQLIDMIGKEQTEVLYRKYVFGSEE